MHIILHRLKLIELLADAVYRYIALQYMVDTRVIFLLTEKTKIKLHVIRSPESM
jgi:hypothetical protein